MLCLQRDQSETRHFPRAIGCLIIVGTDHADAKARKPYVLGQTVENVDEIKIALSWIISKVAGKSKTLAKYILSWRFFSEVKLNRLVSVSLLKVIPSRFDGFVKITPLRWCWLLWPWCNADFYLWQGYLEVVGAVTVNRNYLYAGKPSYVPVKSFELRVINILNLEISVILTYEL